MKTKHLRLMQRAYVILFFCFMYLPIAYMIVFSFNQSKGYALFTGFTLKWYTSLLHNSAILSALRVSLEVALISAVIATVLGTAASLGIASMSRKSRLVVTNITYIPVVNPEIITGISKIEPLKKALGKFHITGMTVYQVLGCGVQHGTQEFEVEEKNKEISLLPKEVVMIVLPTEELDGLLEFVKKELYTGHIGDGKIFVSDVTNVVRVRTGEEGVDALMYGEK